MIKQDKLSNIRHSLAHLLGAAVLELYPDSKLAIGPAIDDGFYYDIDVVGKISDADLPRIEAEMRKILKTWDKFEPIKETVDSAQSRYVGNPYKSEIIQELTDKGEEITSYKSGRFVDLCRGGHVSAAKDINPDAFKLSHVAGAYWKGDEKNSQLTRIYGFAFETKEDLEQHLVMIEEAKKRDHKKIGGEIKAEGYFDEIKVYFAKKYYKLIDPNSKAYRNIKNGGLGVVFGLGINPFFGTRFLADMICGTSRWRKGFIVLAIGNFIKTIGFALGWELGFNIFS